MDSRYPRVVRNESFLGLALTLRSEKGLSYTGKNHHDFAVIVAGPEACSRTAQALGEATQDLITKAVSHTQFPSLLER